MNKHEYAEEVCKYLHKAGYETVIKDNYRNNGALVAIQLKSTPETVVKPVFTIGDEDMKPEEFANYILQFVPADIPTDKLESIIRDKEQVLSRSSYILVNSKLNASRSDLVRRSVNKTLELQYKIDIGDVLPDAKVSLEQKHLDILGINEEELYIRAYENTMERFPYEISTISEMVGILDLLPDELPIYVLTNTKRVYGAGTILYKGMKEVLEEKVGEETIIIPSSIHEVIVLPTYLGEKESITDMIREVNRTVVAPEEVLSDRPYELYSDGMLFEL